MDAKYLIEQLQLQAHPEGGYYRETYRQMKVFRQAMTLSEM